MLPGRGRAAGGWWHALAQYVIRRLIWALPVLLGVAFVTQLMLELTPGDPARVMLGEAATPDTVEALRAELGLDLPFSVRYVRYVSRLAQGDLGKSFRTYRPVVDEIRDAFPNTVLLTAGAMVIAVVVGMTAGIVAAVWRNSILDNASMLLALIGVSMPVFSTGLLLIIWFAHRLGWFPSGGVGSLRHLVLPAITLSLPTLALVARMMRASLLEVLRENYVQTARAKGLRESVVILKHALKNALMPVLTALGTQVGVLMGGAVLTETVFSWPGIGRLIVSGISWRDYLLVQGCVVFLAALFVLVNLLVDIGYKLLDPRIET